MAYELLSTLTSEAVLGPDIGCRHGAKGLSQHRSALVILQKLVR